MDSVHMRRFWDERAVENAYYFVDNRLDYRNPDVEAFWRLGEADLDQLLGLVDQRVKRDDVVVEIGCGVGRMTRPLAERSRQVLAIDVSGEMLDLARTHLADLDNVTLLLGDGASLTGTADSVADLCVSHVVFQHLPSPEIVLAYVMEMGRVLRSGGAAVFQFSNDPAIHRPLHTSVLGRGRQLLTTGPRGQRNRAWLGTAVALDDLRRTAMKAGLEVQRIVNPGSQFCVALLRRT